MRSGSICYPEHNQEVDIAHLFARKRSVRHSQKLQFEISHTDSQKRKTDSFKEVEQECLREYISTKHLCSPENLLIEISALANAIDAKLEQFVNFLNEFRGTLKSTLLLTKKLPLSETDLKYYDQLKQDIIALCSDLSDPDSRMDKNLGIKFNNYLEILKEFKSVSHKARKEKGDTHSFGERA